MQENFNNLYNFLKTEELSVNSINNNVLEAPIILNNSINSLTQTKKSKIKLKHKKSIKIPLYTPLINTILVIIFCYSTHLLKTYIHEFGHILISLVFNWKVHKIILSILPFGSNYTIVTVPGTSYLWQKILLYAFGSIFCFLVGSLILYFGYKEKIKNKSINFMILFTGLYFIMDLPEYIFRDVLFEQAGDWFYVFNYLPGMVIGIFIISFIYLIVNSLCIYRI